MQAKVARRLVDERRKCVEVSDPVGLQRRHDPLEDGLGDVLGGGQVSQSPGEEELEGPGEARRQLRLESGASGWRDDATNARHPACSHLTMIPARLAAAPDPSPRPLL